MPLGMLYTIIHMAAVSDLKVTDLIGAARVLAQAAVMKRTLRWR